MAGEIQDMEFPEVPAEWEIGKVKQLAQQTVSIVIQMMPSAAMVQGEGTMMYWLVRYLEHGGVPCYAATSRRSAFISQDSKGATIKQSRFEFVCFRRFEE
jgi:hypothetical protein